MDAREVRQGDFPPEFRQKFGDGNSIFMRRKKRLHANGKKGKKRKRDKVQANEKKKSPDDALSAP